MSATVELEFKIGVHTPETMPMDRLVQYLGNLSRVLGHRRHVHFLAVRDGSTTPVLRVDRDVYPQVEERVQRAQKGRGPREAVAALDAIERDLEEDNATSSELSGERGRLLHFPATAIGREYGPFSQAGTLDGVPVVVGGQNDPVPVHLEDEGRVHHCLARRDLAKRISDHLFETTVRVSGVGRWVRSRRGLWVMRSFRIEDYEELSHKTLGEVHQDLQAIDSSWKDRSDALGDLVKLREPENSR